MTDAEDLKSRQEAFLHAVLDENAPFPEGWGNSQAAGMSVYRGNYRSALLSALTDTYERTARHVGADAFRKASMHHAIAHPPAGWTIDEVGAAFDITCRELFGNNPEVADLAWLEWTMMKLASAPDCAPMTQQAFAEATSGFGDAEWMELRIDLQPASKARVIESNLSGLWEFLGSDADRDRPAPRLQSPRGCIVSREGEQPAFQMVDAPNASVYHAAQSGASYGDLIVMLAGDGARPEDIQNAAMSAGQMLGGWLVDGLVAGLRT